MSVATIAKRLAGLPIEEHFVRASGPGGQNVNKVATAVELRLDVRASSLAPDVQDRLIALAGHRATAEGVVTIDSRQFRSQERNREAARERLVALLDRAATRPKKRKPTRPKTAARERRLESKRIVAVKKASRSPRARSDD